MDATEASPSAGSGIGILGPENFLPIIIAIAVLGAGLALIYYWQSYKHSKNFQINTGKLSLFGIIFLAFTFALKFFRWNCNFIKRYKQMLCSSFENKLFDKLKIFYLTKKILFRKSHYTLITTSVTNKTFETEKLFLLLI